MAAMPEDDWESMPSAEAIALAEKMLGYMGPAVPKKVAMLDLKQLVDLLRSQLDEIDTDQADLSVFDLLKCVIAAASALRQYSKHMSFDVPTYNHAAELQLRAERKAGQWITKHVDVE